MAMNIVVTGANRGIGLEFVRQYLTRGDTVIAATRAVDTAALGELKVKYPASLRVLACDVASDTSVHSFAEAVGNIAVDVLINNAGVMSERGGLTELDMTNALDTYNINALGPLRVSRALLPHLRRGHGKRIANISSGLGSLSDNGSGGMYAYRLSKAALNMASRNMALELAHDGILSVAFNPGWVKTDMGGPSASITVDRSVQALITRIDALTTAESGGFYDWKGPVFAW
jgi:NAD(P)-dependent dehydrogenase (short-subunit alcohol dehydrogenase family)